MASVTDFPEPVHTAAGGITAWWRHSGLLLGRQIKVWLRDPGTLGQSIIFPALSMVMFKVVLGDTIGQATGQNSAYSTVPLVILVGAMFGGMATSVRLSVERRTGLLARLYVMPIHRGADLTSRIVAELLRILLTSIVLVAAGFLIGFRFTQGPWAALGILGVPLLYGAAFSIMTLALAVNSSRIPLVPILSLFCSLMMFFNSGFAPVESFPTWLQGVVKYQPMSCAIEVMRSLAAGGPITENLIRTAIWAGAMLVIFTIPALIGYRRAATARD
ncbi:ABC transporter permease [Jongsikchunia kroppenstedtii]|uniref:ABC transporter permease n=1 Tax=Jongsikchunia kroppenstedtii TaxID=1121721 RepID=UPI000687AA3E|nr:ABC transporter permease [Jongsikchunia kroppenstedtii]